MLAFVVVIQRFFAINAMSFRLSDNSLNDFPAMLIEISNAIASCYLKYSKNFRDLSSMPATLCNAKFATAIRSRMDEPGTCGIASPLCTSSVASRIHYSLQNESPKIMHMLCKTKHVETKAGHVFQMHVHPLQKNSLSTFEYPECTFDKHVCGTFQWYSSCERPSLWPLKEPTSKAYMGTRHHQPKRSDPKCWHRASKPSNLCQNPKTNISLTPHLAKELNRILCGCSNLEHAVGMQRWVYASHSQPLSRRESDASFGNLVHIFLWWKEKAN